MKEMKTVRTYTVKVVLEGGIVHETEPTSKEVALECAEMTSTSGFKRVVGEQTILYPASRIIQLVVEPTK